MEALRKDKSYTYADYASWDTEERYELIDGVPYMMAAPSITHQRISGNLHGELWNFLRGKPCKVFSAPLDVRLNAAADNDVDVVQPDLMVVCDRSKIDEKGCNGAPDLVIEILSPSSISHDKLRKFNKYLQTGVREYWIVDPYNKMVTVNILDNGKYYNTAYGETDTVPVHILEGCEISLSDVFAEG